MEKWANLRIYEFTNVEWANERVEELMAWFVYRALGS